MQVCCTYVWRHIHKRDVPRLANVRRFLFTQGRWAHVHICSSLQLGLFKVCLSIQQSLNESFISLRTTGPARERSRVSQKQLNHLQVRRLIPRWGLLRQWQLLVSLERSLATGEGWGKLRECRVGRCARQNTNSLARKLTGRTKSRHRTRLSCETASLTASTNPDIPTTGTYGRTDLPRSDLNRLVDASNFPEILRPRTDPSAASPIPAALPFDCPTWLISRSVSRSLATSPAPVRLQQSGGERHSEM